MPTLPTPSADKSELARMAHEAASLHAQGKLHESERRYEAILRLDRNYVDALHLLGVVRAQQGRHQEAIALIGQAVRLNPGFAPAFNSLGNALRALGRGAEAIATYRKALSIRPDYADAHCNLGDGLRDLMRYEEAVASYRRAVAARPEYAEANFRLGVALHALSRHDEAIASYRRALALRPDHAEGHHSLGVALCATDRHEDAVASYRRALVLAPDHAEALNNLGVALRILKRCEESAAACRKALAIRADFAEAHANLGNALGELGSHEAALESLQQALALAPADPQVHNNLGIALGRLNRHQEAELCFRHAIAIVPDHAQAHLNRGVALLAAGDLSNGWEEYEWRWRAGLVHPGDDYSKPRWTGTEGLQGRAILLHAEQGFGDTLQFLRYAPLLAQAGARVMLRVPASLKALAAEIPGVDQVVSTWEPVPCFDLHCPLMSVARAVGTRLDTIPCHVPYLRVPSGRLTAWRGRLGHHDCPRIGLAWSGNPGHANDRARSIALKRLLPLVSRPGLRFFSLQKDTRSEDAKTLAGLVQVTDLAPWLADFSDTAAAVSMLDLVVTLDSAVAHLAGALGKPAWILLPFSADWRWLVAREDSPWYPTVRLFRQPQSGDWESVIEKVTEALSARFESTKSP